MLTVLVLLSATPLQAESAEFCSQCHASEYATWRRSRHAQAHTNELYRLNHAQEPMRWCDSCHAPTSEGVSCASCHVRGGVVLTTRTPSAEGLAAHPLAQSTTLGSEGVCEGCHEARFPLGRAEPVKLSSFSMQATVSEWRASGSKQRCQSCHMPSGSHDLRGGHDVDLVRSALDVSVTRTRGDEVQVLLRNKTAPHQLPTGDPFRALLIELCDDAACSQVATARRVGVTQVTAGKSWRLVDDWRIPAATKAGPGERRLDFKAPATAKWFRVRLQYVSDSLAAAAPEESQAVLFVGAVSP